MRWASMLGLVLACATGCTQAFGLDSARDDDKDADHIADGSDNCPDVFNPDQSRHDMSDPRGDACRVCMAIDPADSDGDGIPDECDGCDNRLPDGNNNGVPDACENPHDEDGDGVPDLVDNCPSVSNADQADDGDSKMPDGVGTACDLEPGADGQFFDSFVQHDQLWLTSGKWIDGNDHAIAPLSATGPTRVAGIGIGIFTVSTALTMTGSGSAGVVALDSSSQNIHVECGISVAGGAYFAQLSITYNGTTNTAFPPISFTPHGADPVKLEIAPAVSLSAMMATCSVAGTMLSGNIATTSAFWHPGLAAYYDGGASPESGTAQFEYFDVVTRMPQ